MVDFLSQFQNYTCSILLLLRNFILCISLNLSRCTLFIFTKDKKYAIVAFLNDYSKGKLQVDR